MPPHSPEKKSRILTAAREVCSEGGYEAARMEEIARRAEVSKGTLYNFFESKEALLLATVLASHQDYVVILPAVEDPTLDVRDRLAALIESLADGFEGIVRHNMLAQQAWSVVLGSPSMRQELLSALRAIYTGYIEQLQSILEAGVRSGVLRSEIDIPVVATNWLAIYSGLLYRAGFEEDDPNPAYTPAGVRQSLGWLTEQLLSDEALKTRASAREENTHA